MGCTLVVLASTLLAIGIGEAPYKTVVAPAGPENARNTEAAVLPLRDGSLLLSWTEFYTDSGSDHGPARICGKVSKDGGRTWGGKWTIVENDAKCNVMEVNLLRLKNGHIALFYCKCMDSTGETDCRIMMRTSSDEGKTWG